MFRIQNSERILCASPGTTMRTSTRGQFSCKLGARLVVRGLNGFGAACRCAVVLDSTKAQILGMALRLLGCEIVFLLSGRHQDIPIPANGLTCDLYKYMGLQPHGFKRYSPSHLSSQFVHLPRLSFRYGIAEGTLNIRQL